MESALAAKMTPVDMFNELVRLGYVVPASSDPNSMMVPTAYVSAPSYLAFSTPPVHQQKEKAPAHAKLGARRKRNRGRKG